MNKNYKSAPSYCPEHPKEHLEFKTLIVKHPDCPKGEGIPMIQYCKKSDKYLDYNNKLASKEEVLLEFLNKNFKKEYKLSEIEVITSF